jgi:hypothetical protein
MTMKFLDLDAGAVWLLQLRFNGFLAALQRRGGLVVGLRESWVGGCPRLRVYYQVEGAQPSDQQVAASYAEDPEGPEPRAT